MLDKGRVQQRAQLLVLYKKDKKLRCLLCGGQGMFCIRPECIMAKCQARAIVCIHRRVLAAV